jgi:hypothetical protein
VGATVDNLGETGLIRCDECEHWLNSYHGERPAGQFFGQTAERTEASSIGVGASESILPTCWVPFGNIDGIEAARGGYITQEAPYGR